MDACQRGVVRHKTVGGVGAEKRCCGELTLKETEGRAEWDLGNGCFPVQAVNLDSFRKALIGVHVSCELSACFCGQCVLSVGLNNAWGKWENDSFLSRSYIMLCYCSCRVLG